MDLQDLIGTTEKKTVRSAPTIVGKNCRKCGNYHQQDMYLKAESWFFPDGYLDICNECLDKYFGDCMDLEKADKFCQYADIPFNVNEWMSLAESIQYGAFKNYVRQYWSEEYEAISWKKVHDEWIAILKDGDERNHLDCFKQEDIRQLKEKWGRNFSDAQLIQFEKMYEDIEKTQSITTAIQKDNARKMCMLSYKIEQAIWDEDENGKGNGTEVKSLIGAYDQLAKSADFTPKTAKNIGDFESVGELFAFLEKRGWKNKYYDWKPRDEVDKVMSNLQTYTKRIIIGETNIAEELNDKLEQIKNLNAIDSSGAMSDEEFLTVHYEDDLADELMEEWDGEEE